MRMTSSVMLTLTMTMMMQEAVTHSQGNKWEEILRRAPTISRVFTMIWNKEWKQYESSPKNKEGAVLTCIQNDANTAMSRQVINQSSL